MKCLVVILLFAQLFVASQATTFSSSVWCHGSHQSHRHCSFRNLCFSPSVKQFLFFHSSDESVVSGIDAPSEQIRLARLSSLEGLEENEDDLYLDYTMLPAHLTKNFDVTFEEKQTLFIKRWKPDLLQHVFHDDLIPIYFTMKFLCYGNATECLEKYQIVITDGSEKESRYEELYAKILSPSNLVYQRDQVSDSRKKLICYKKATVGLETETIWHDYGFYLNGREGPRDNPNLRQSYIEEFRSFVIDQLKNDQQEKTDVIFLLPEIKLRLKNQEQVSNLVQEIVSKKLGKNAKYEVVDPSTVSVESLLTKASRAKLLIGMTGSEMIASLFLPPKNSAIVEMFPYGLGPDVSSFIQTLSSVRNLVYHSWVNHIKSNSISHPENEPHLGGLVHLDKSVRRAIERMDHVGDVKCCDDPAYLHKFHQETIVDKDSFEQIVVNALDDLNGRDSGEDNDDTRRHDEWMLPSKIFDAKCTLKKSEDSGDRQVYAEVTWEKPLNLDHIPHKSVIYEVVAQADLFGDSAGTELIGEYSTHDRSAGFSIFALNLRKYRNVKVWVAVVLDHDLRGSDTFVKCNLDSQILM